MKTINRIIVATLIFSKDNQLFFGKKATDEGGVYSDCWHIPGGGVDSNESQKEALIREIYEEVGLDISKYDIQLVDDKGRGVSEKTLRETKEKVICTMQFNVFKVVIHDKNSNEVKVSLNDDLVEYMWLKVSKLGTIKHTPPSIALFKRLKYLN